MIGSDDMPDIEIPQPIPREVCLACDVCCRFPERDSFLAPVFTEDDITHVIDLKNKGVQFRPVRSSAGGQVVPVPSDTGFRCPFFEPKTHCCGIYDERPLDCRLYPYALMLDPSSSGIWLGIDTKCPATDDPDLMQRIAAEGGKIWEAAASPDLVRLVKSPPRIVGPYQPDVLPLFRLEELTSALLAAKKLIPWRSPSNAFSVVSPDVETTLPPSRITSPRPLTLADRAIMEKYLKRAKPRLAGQSFATQFMASDLMALVWCEIEGFFCLWAFDKGTVYMSLPPLGSLHFRGILPTCFAFMDEHNQKPEISRIENLSLEDIPKNGLAGYEIRPGYPEYVYRREDLVVLQGRTFRGRRADWRAFARETTTELRPYRPADRAACLDLFDRWQANRMKKQDDPVARQLLEDARSIHHLALEKADAIGLVGRVVTVKGNPAAYTFGTPLNQETFVIVLEVTDPSYRGASAYVFREFSRELKGYKYINVMDDSGLPGLRRLKRSYHPLRLEPSFVLYRK